MDELTVGIAALERTPLFAGLDRDDLRQVLGCRQRVSFERGQAIVERWDPGDADVHHRVGRRRGGCGWAVPSA